MLQSIAIMCCIDKSTNYAPNSFALLSAVLKVEYKYHSNRFYLSCKLSKWCINTWEITTQKWWWPKLNVGLGNDGKKSSRLFIMVDLKVILHVFFFHLPKLYYNTEQPSWVILFVVHLILQSTLTGVSKWSNFELSCEASKTTPLQSCICQVLTQIK